MTEQHGSTGEAVLKTIDHCIEEDILAEYFTERRWEAIDIMMALFDDEINQKMLLNSEKAEGRKEGENKLASLISRLLSDGRTDDVAKAAEDTAYREELYKEYSIS